MTAITDPLPRTSTERLRRIARIIREEPERFDMWDFVSNSLGAADVWGHPPTDCGTTCCVAGWAVALTPKDRALPRPSWCSAAWHSWGAYSLDLGTSLSADVFYGWSGLDPEVIADRLDVLADMPVIERRRLRHWHVNATTPGLQPGAETTRADA